MMNNKINTMIQFALRARKIGYKQNLDYLASKGKLKLIIIATDAAESTKSEAKSFPNVKVIEYLTKSELGTLLNKDNIAIFGITDPNIAKQIKILNKEEIN